MLIFLCVLAIVAFVVERWSLAHGLDGVSHEHSPSKRLVEPDERFELITLVANSSRRFIPFIRMQEEIPQQAETKGERIQRGYGAQSYMSSSFYLMPKQTLERRVEMSIDKRGVYAFKGAVLYGGDFLGISERRNEFLKRREIVVIPTRYEDTGFERTLGGFLGDVSVSRFLFEDPVLTLGFREYTGSEPQKMIAWAQSARSGRLMVKKYDYTLEARATVLLNVDCAPYNEAQVERCLSMARSVCESLEQSRIQYAFMMNASTVGAAYKWRHVPQGLGSQHLNYVLEGLGRAMVHSGPVGLGGAEAFSQTLERAKHNAQRGQGHIIITPGSAHDDTWRGSLASLETMSGAKALILSAREETRA